MDPQVVLEICGGNLAKAYDESEKYSTLLSARLDGYRKRSDEHPSIYIRILCQRLTADPLTVSRARVLAVHMRAYAKQNPTHKDAAYRVDRVFDKKNRWTQKMSDDGERWYLQTKSSAVSDKCVKNIQVFADKLDSLYDHCTARHEIFMPLVQYVGYAIKASVRQYQHESHSATNYLCMFVHTLAEALWPQTYEMRTFTICLITEEWGRPVSEMLLTRLAHAYYHAGGFSIDQAGKSMRSLYMDKLTPEERQEVWEGCLEWVENNTPYHKNTKLEIPHRERLRQRQLEEELHDLKEKHRAIVEAVAQHEKDYEEMTRGLDRDHMKNKFPKDYERLLEFERNLQIERDELAKTNEIGPFPTDDT
jgi:hypothetical protein